VAYAKEVNPDLRFFFTSAMTGEGVDEWLEFIRGLATGVETAG
jgi:Ni2+-binding GTPase involved in maturation of urease and hydrogenase